VYTIEVDDKALISKVAILLSKIYPLSSCLQHLKRVKPVFNKRKLFQLIVGPVGSLDKAHIIQQLQEINYQNLNIFKVPKSKPYNRWQFEECVKYWPTNFHENK
jgi:hypothetical protein